LFLVVVDFRKPNLELGNTSVRKIISVQTIKNLSTGVKLSFDKN